jgi:hypothetical protein
MPFLTVAVGITFQFEDRAIRRELRTIATDVTRHAILAGLAGKTRQRMRRQSGGARKN